MNKSNTILVNTNTVIVGASAAGLANAACLMKKNIDFVILEKESHVANNWRNHYERLHLHTNKSSSHLPYKKFPKNVAKHPSRIEVINYFEDYCKSMKISPVFNTLVEKVEFKDGYWITKTNNQTYKSKNLIIATGNTNVPKLISKPGINSFSGEIIHSSQYKNGEKWKGKNVLVIGFGNSACEIAICLHEHGALPSLSVRAAVNVVPRHFGGVLIQKMSVFLAKIPYKISDKLCEPFIKMNIGDIRKYDLKKLPYGPMEQIVKYQQVPLLDMGTIDLLKKGEITIFGDIKNINGNLIEFENNKSKKIDAIIMGTGYETGLEKFITITEKRKKDIKENIKKRKNLGEKNLYFSGFCVAPLGTLREIGVESKIIAEKIYINQ
jgi:indole-3-pyruvate monooxygenase